MAADAAAAPATVASSLRELLKVQERRAQAYARLHAGFRQLTGGGGGKEGAAAAPGAAAAAAPKIASGAAGEPAYASLLSELTSEFADLSSRARAVEAALLRAEEQQKEEGRGGSAAATGGSSASAPAQRPSLLVRRVQEAEREKLRLELALQRLRRPHAAGAFSWQRAEGGDDAGVGGPLDPAELARLRARGCGCGGGGGGGAHSHDGGARDQGEEQGAGPPPQEPTEAEWRGAVDEAVRELDAVIGRINETVEEAMMALEDEEEGEDEQEGGANEP